MTYCTKGIQITAMEVLLQDIVYLSTSIKEECLLGELELAKHEQPTPRWVYSNMHWVYIEGS